MVDFVRFPRPENFRFLEKMKFKASGFTNGEFNAGAGFLQDGILKITCVKKGYQEENYSEMVPREFPVRSQTKTGKGSVAFVSGRYSAEFSLDAFSLTLKCGKKIFLQTDARFIGFNGARTIFRFLKEKDSPSWGFGEKTSGLNKNGKAMKMWNIDAWVDHPGKWNSKDYDPAYVSIPFFMIKIRGRFTGFFLNNPCETFFNMGQADPESFHFGAYDGTCTLYIIPGDSPADVVRKFSQLTVLPDMPPLWSLGHHQARWGYTSTDKVREVVKGFRKSGIPLGAIWLDIDYMEGYRVFTWNKKKYKDHEELIRELHSSGIRLVTIVDPGIKQEKGNPEYEEGRDGGFFCRTWNGLEYTGLVWPGKTVFPDFSLERTRTWWAGKVARFLEAGVDGIWIDMNDPATGDSERGDMLFKEGKVEHQFYHNQYAHLMARATKEGFQQKDNTIRPFILTRSGCTGTQKYSAVWTGDNFSSWEHLQMTIPESLNLSLSGISFNGADIGGFGGDTNEKLIVRWYQANFLFPFCRNHSVINSMEQEPFRFSKNARPDHEKIY